MAKTKLNLKPLGDRVVVEPLEKEEKTASGIILPETAKEKPQEGEILAVGPGRTDDDGKRIPSTSSSSRPKVFDSSTVITPSLPTFSIASAIESPISASLSPSPAG